MIPADCRTNAVLLGLVFTVMGTLATVISFFTAGIAFAWVANAIAAVWIVNSPRRHGRALVFATLLGDLVCNLVTFSTFRATVMASYGVANLVEVMVAVAVMRARFCAPRAARPATSSWCSA